MEQGYWGATEQRTRLRIQATSTIESDGLRSGRNRVWQRFRDRLGHMTVVLRAIWPELPFRSRPVACQRLVLNLDTLSAQGEDGTFQIRSIPEDDGSHYQIEAAG
jgi:hypothetical protein